MASELSKIESAIPFTTYDNDDGGGISLAMLNWVVSRDGEVPPYWSRTRDRWLREFVYSNGPLKTAVNTFVNKVVTIPWQIQARDRSIYRQVRSAQTIQEVLRRYSGSMSSGPLRGFKETMKMFVSDYLCSDNGAFLLVLGEGPANGPIIGAPTGVMHLDSHLVVRTKDPEFPIKYMNSGTNGDSKEYKIHYTRCIAMSNLPSPNVDLNGVGLCAVSCCIEAAQELWDIYRYSQEMFGSRPPRQILYAKTGATVKNLEDAVRAWEMKLDNENRKRFGGTMIAAPRLATQNLELDIINLSSMPENYNRKDVTTINKSEIAAAFGLDLRDLSYTLGAPSRTGDAEVQDRKGRGKGVGEFLETFTERFNEVYLNADIHYISFDYLDDEEDEQRAMIRDRRSAGRERDLRAGVTTIRVERELMWEAGEISQEQFEDMELMDGRLPEGLDVLLLFQSQDADYREWLDLGVADPTNIVTNDPEMMAEVIHQRYIEISQYVHMETRPERRRKARRALAALDKLRSMYQTPEGTSITEQASLEAEDEGGEQLGQENGEATAVADDAEDEEKDDDDDEQDDDEQNATATKELDLSIAELQEYERQLTALVEYAAAQEMPEERFKEALANFVAAAIVALFLRGARKEEGQLTIDERQALQAQVIAHQASIEAITRDLYAGRYAENNLGLQAALTRISMWVNNAASDYFLGMTYRADDPFLQWRMGPTKEHCTTCNRLHGQVHRASEWRAAGWYPRSFRLECTGVHCRCGLYETVGPGVGNF